MKVLYESKFLKILFDQERSYMKVLRTKETEFYTDKEYLQEQKIWRDLVEKTKPKYALIDQREFAYIIPPDIQQIIQQTTIHSAIKNKLKKLAIVEAKDIFTKVSTNQLFENVAIELKFFKDINQAEKWIFE